MDNLAVHDELDGLNRCDFTNRPHMCSNVVRTHARFVDDISRTFCIHVQENERPCSDETAAFSHTLEPGSKIRLFFAADISLAVAKFAAGWIIARSGARKAIADTQDLIPTGKFNPSVDTKLKKLDGIDA